MALGLSGHKSIYHDCQRFYYAFKNRFGTTKCKDITGIRFKHGYEIRRFFIKGIVCLKVVYTSINSIFEIIGSYKKDESFTEKKFDCAKEVLLRISLKKRLNIDPLLKITPGLSGGLSFQGDICGALVGGALALGSVYGKEIAKICPLTLMKAGLFAFKDGGQVFHKEWLHPSFRASSRVSLLYRAFTARFGSADCRMILKGEPSIKQCKEVIETVSKWTTTLISEEMT